MPCPRGADVLFWQSLPVAFPETTTAFVKWRHGVQYFDRSKNIKVIMDTTEAVDKLSALAQATRLRIFRMLVEAGPEGVNAGAIAEALDLPGPTLSFHVAHLARAGLVASRQESRFIFYSASFPAMDDLIAYLTDNCCQGGQCLPKTAVATTAKRRSKAIQSS